MKSLRRSLLIALWLALIAGPRAFAGPTEAATPALADELDAPRFQFSAESTYLLGIIGNPNSYEIGGQFFTGRMRWGAVHDPDSWLRGFNQVYLLAMGESIFRGPENYYFGLSTGLRYNFVRPGAHWVPYVSGGVGIGWIDSHANVFGAQGEDLTFNILTAAGVQYKIDPHWELNVGVLYQHLSNAGLTDPNPSLNLLGPQIGATFSF